MSFAKSLHDRAFVLESEFKALVLNTTMTRRQKRNAVLEILNGPEGMNFVIDELDQNGNGTKRETAAVEQMVTWLRNNRVRTRRRRN